MFIYFKSDIDSSQSVNCLIHKEYLKTNVEKAVGKQATDHKVVVTIRMLHYY